MNNLDNEEIKTRKMGMGMVVAMWLIVLGLLTAYFSHWQDKEYNPNQHITSIEGKGQEKQVNLKRNRYGHYVATGAINDMPVVFILDTGATDISVPQSVAQRLQLKPGAAVYYQTANGSAKAYATRLERVSLGAIELNDVRAHINPNVNNNEVLLGMTFLKHLEFSQKGDTLTIKQY